MTINKSIQKVGNKLVNRDDFVYTWYNLIRSNKVNYKSTTM